MAGCSWDSQRTDWSIAVVGSTLFWHQRSHSVAAASPLAGVYCAILCKPDALSHMSPSPAFGWLYRMLSSAHILASSTGKHLGTAEKRNSSGGRSGAGMPGHAIQRQPDRWVSAHLPQGDGGMLFFGLVSVLFGWSGCDRVQNSGTPLTPQPLWFVVLSTRMLATILRSSDELQEPNRDDLPNLSFSSQDLALDLRTYAKTTLYSVGKRLRGFRLRHKHGSRPRSRQRIPRGYVLKTRCLFPALPWAATAVQVRQLGSSTRVPISKPQVLEAAVGRLTSFSK
ncbi:hypothetical protein B0H67DRAFT_139110 [Lasiosphaeris hirsuta]|uniref:Uncharacterized protein n=1 Tax=Lasiosphaeris hirsuta TaxID=260670 RepID=A0AA40B137_9PEZI|nr:hypothetical protein B0H67DRAFT_139110 [Lasiosphaeris hirsuta]